MGASNRVRTLFSLLLIPTNAVDSLGPVMISSYNLAFQTRLFAALPPSFSTGFKHLCEWTLSPEASSSRADFSSSPTASALPAAAPLPKSMTTVWKHCEELGLIEKYESTIANVCYERIERLVQERCVKNWEKPMLEDLREWVRDNVLPWVMGVYAARCEFLFLGFLRLGFVLIGWCRSTRCVYA